MSILIESQLAHMLKDPQLKTREREHLEELRELNRKYMKENVDYYPKNPFDHGEGHVRSIIELRVGEVYNVLTQRAENEPFEIAEIVKVEGVKPIGLISSTPPFEINVQILRPGGVLFAMREAADMGLEPLPAIALPEEMQNLAGHIWAPDVYTQKSPTPPSQFL